MASYDAAKVTHASLGEGAVAGRALFVCQQQRPEAACKEVQIEPR